MHEKNILYTVNHRHDVLCSCLCTCRSPDTKVTPVKQQQKFTQNVVPCEYLFTVDKTCDVQCLYSLLHKDYSINNIKAIGNNLFLVTFTIDPGLDALLSMYNNVSTIKAMQSNFKYKLR